VRAWVVGAVGVLLLTIPTVGLLSELQKLDDATRVTRCLTALHSRQATDQLRPLRFQEEVNRCNQTGR
jgi:hypothetical protein